MDRDPLSPTPPSHPQEDRERFARWYELYHERILAQCSRMLRDRAAAEDITHEALLRAWYGRDRMRDDELGGWLTVVAKNLCISYIRRQQRTVPMDALPEIAEDDADPANIVIEKESRRSVRRALSQVGERHRRVLYMREFHELELDEIGSELGLTYGGTRAVLFRARRMMRQRLAAVGEGLGAWIVGVRVRIGVAVRGAEAGAAPSIQAGLSLALAAGIALATLAGADGGAQNVVQRAQSAVGGVKAEVAEAFAAPARSASVLGGEAARPASAAGERHVLASVPRSPVPPPAAYDPRTGDSAIWIRVGPVEYGIKGTRYEDGRACKTCGTKDTVFTTACRYDERMCDPGGLS